MKDMLTIGEFAAAARLSQKALRLYGENGVLPPAWVDPDSGYRYYSLAQVREATLIALLRRAGMPLAEIRGFIHEPSLERLDAYEHQLNDELAQRRHVLRYVKRMLKEESMYDLSTKRVAAQPYVSRNKRILVPDLERFICDTFDELGAPGVGNAPPFVLYHGPVNNEDDGPVEVCVPRADGEGRLPAGEVVFTEISGRQCNFPEILGAYEAVYAWAKENGRAPGGPPREIYLDTSPDQLRMEIALPLA